MPFADGSLLRVGFVPEASFGVLPATPTFQVMRTTGGGIDINKATAVSEEITADRNQRDEYLLGIDYQGSYGFELSYASFDALIAAVLCGTWSGDVVKNGVTQQSFAFEETLTVGASNYFSRVTGAKLDKLDLTVTARKAVTGSFTIMGQREATDGAPVAGATYTAANTNPVLTSSANVGALAIAGINPAPKVKSLSLSVANNYRTREVVGDVYSAEHGIGQCDVTGTFEAYFENNALYQAVVAHGGGALSFTVGAGAGQKYLVTLPNIVFLNGKKSNRARNTDVMVNIPFRAKFDPTAAASIVITRNVG